MDYLTPDEGHLGDSWQPPGAEPVTSGPHCDRVTGRAAHGADRGGLGAGTWGAFILSPEQGPQHRDKPSLHLTGKEHPHRPAGPGTSGTWTMQSPGDPQNPASSDVTGWPQDVRVGGAMAATPRHRNRGLTTPALVRQTSAHIWHCSNHTLSPPQGC